MALDDSFEITFRTGNSQRFEDTPDLYRALTSVTVDLSKLSDNEENENENDETKVRIGGVEGYLVNVSWAQRTGLSICDMLDCIGSEEEECYSAVFSDDDWREDLEVTLGFPRHLLVVSRMDIDQEYRHKGVGLALLQKMLESPSVPCATLVILKPYAMGHSDEDAAQAAGTKKLAAYWSRAGFTEIEDGHGYYMRYIE